MVALARSGLVLSESSSRSNLELLGVELAHLIQAEPALTLAESKEGHLQGSTPAEAEVHREVALHLVHDTEAC